MAAAQRHLKDSSLMSWTDADLNNDLAPAGKEVAPREKLCLSWKRPCVVGAGLQNIGNACYMNAALQCLTHTPPLANYLLSRKHSQTCRHRGFCRMCVLEAHVTRALRHSGYVVQPVLALAAGFHTYEQEDTHEFLMFTMDGMEKSCLSGDNQLDPHSQDKTLIRQIFGGYWRSQIKCLHCHSTSDTFDPYLDVILDIEEAQSVNQALEDLVKPEELNGENAYHCTTCLKKVPASKTLTLQTCAKVLMLVLKRFSDFTGDKIAKIVQYPEYLDMQPYLSQQNRGPLVYVLYAVLVHAGRNSHNGHYFCYVKAGNGQWYKMDDARVTACDIASVLSQNAYILFYVQKSDFKRDSTVLKPEDKDMRAQQRELKKGSYVEGVESLEHLGDTATKELTLDQWKVLQAQNRTKSEFNFRKTEFSLPPNVVVIHQSKYRGKMSKNPLERESYPLNNSAWDMTDQKSLNTYGIPSLGGRPRANKRKNKQRKRTLIV